MSCLPDCVLLSIFIAASAERCDCLFHVLLLDFKQHGHIHVGHLLCLEECECPCPIALTTTSQFTHQELRRRLIGIRSVQRAGISPRSLPTKLSKSTYLFR